MPGVAASTPWYAFLRSQLAAYGQPSIRELAITTSEEYRMGYTWQWFRGEKNKRLLLGVRLPKLRLRNIGDPIAEVGAAAWRYLRNLAIARLMPVFT